MVSQPEPSIYSNREELAAALADHVALLGQDATTQRGRFSVALSGGSLIDIIGPRLTAAPLISRIDWTTWHVFWADERWVPKHSPESNYHQADRQILARVGIPSAQIHAVDDSLDPAETAAAYASAMADACSPRPGQVPRFDLILLGVGEDGHTASLFPGHPALRETRRWAVPVMDAPKPPAVRITMTLPVINNARNVIFVAAGHGKAGMIARLFDPAGAGRTLPARRVSPSAGVLRWFIDRPAAAGLG